MEVTKKEDHILFKNELGEYHMMLPKFNKLGEGEQEYAENEILKKSKSVFTGDTINFSQARELGFCEYGIKDFCETLGLNIDSTYEIEALNKALTVDVLKEYPDECVKLFGRDTLKHLGGVKGVLSEDTIELVLRPEFIDEITLHKLSVKFAYQCIDKFEEEYPDDKRPREAIEAKEAWIRGDITGEQLSAAWSAAWSAVESARSAAWSAAWSAVESARSAAWSAVESARSAVESAAWSAVESARSAARKRQVVIILEGLK